MRRRAELAKANKRLLAEKRAQVDYSPDQDGGDWREATLADAAQRAVSVACLVSAYGF